MKMDKRADELLHILWSKSVGQENYDKEQWKELSHFIESFVYEGEDETRLTEVVLKKDTTLYLCESCLKGAGDKIGSFL